jgi:hypothetical protein
MSRHRIIPTRSEKSRTDSRGAGRAVVSRTGTQVASPFRPIVAKGGIDHRLSKLRNQEGHDPSPSLRARFYSCRLGIRDDERADPAQPPPARTRPWQLRLWARQSKLHIFGTAKAVPFPGRERVPRPCPSFFEGQGGGFDFQVPSGDHDREGHEFHSCRLGIRDDKRADPAQPLPARTRSC